MLEFMTACGIDYKSIPQFTTASFYSSHEALLLNYEQAFVKNNSENNISAIMKFKNGVLGSYNSFWSSPMVKTKKSI